MTLPIVRIERNMAYLDLMGQAIPLSLRELKAGDKVGDQLEVFLWTQRNTELIATRQMPLVKPGEIAFLQVQDVSNGTGFVNIGLDEDVPLYTSQQSEPIEAGKRYFMTMVFDQQEQRLVMSTKLNNMFEENPPYKMGDEVKFMIIEKVERGRKALVDMKYLAFIPQADLLPGTRRGDLFTGYVRENEPRNFSITMFKPGKEKVDDAIERIMDLLQQHRGYLRLSDKTPSEEIQLRLRTSKKTFKQAIGQLYRAGKIDITPRGIKLKRTE